ncbi:ArsR/SmtB family transcription factor [Gemmata sp. SH-PL17]|uniref:ArsR/SmtB family transcription factor n=1 Tax=Gemmata sp. SH-PL17 TaxID=1630693 RepID=UPI001390035B|nr:metalloregulator ArsR/SmtB family transcription factor [Gemmata sp. SH-PL17]
MESSPLDRNALEAVSRLFAVLAEPTRLAILQCLKSGPKAVSELVDELGAKQANISKQLGILYAAGLLSRERDGNLVRYSIAESMIFELCELVCGKLRRDAERRLEALGGEEKSRK